MLTVTALDLRVGIPVELAEEMGVRPLINAEEMREIFDLLLAPSGPFDKVWARRFKDYNERLRRGDIRTTACLIRDLMRRNEEKKMSYGEITVMRQARAPFLTELAVALSKPEEEIEAMVDAAILEGVAPSIADAELSSAS